MKHLLQLDILVRDGSQSDVPACPAFKRLLARARAVQAYPSGAASWLQQAFGALCAAPYSALGDGLPAQQGCWLRADPVYLHLMRDRVILPQAAVDDVDVAEAQALVQALNAHFTELRFYAPHPQRWYVQITSPQQLITREPEQVVGRDIRPNMPQGADGKVWIGRLNEAQMLLHQHPVNEAREAVGKLPVNSLWLWGGGFWQGLGKPPYDQCWGSDPLLAGLTGNQHKPLPDNLQNCLQHPAPRQLLVLSAGQDGEGLEQRWFVPAWEALRRGQVETARLIWSAEGALQVATIRRSGLWRFWFSGF